MYNITFHLVIFNVINMDCHKYHCVLEKNNLQVIWQNYEFVVWHFKEHQLSYLKSQTETNDVGAQPGNFDLSVVVFFLSYLFLEQ